MVGGASGRNRSRPFNRDGTMLAVARCGSVPRYDTATLELRVDIPIGSACFAGFGMDGEHW
jgi:hypothetical protein